MKYLLLFLCLVLCSCSDEYYGCAGKRKSRQGIVMKQSSEESNNSGYSGCEPPPPPDNIKPSSEELWFNAKGGIDSITTEGESWHIEDATIIIQDSVIFLRSNQYYIRGDGLEELHSYEYNIPHIVDEGIEYSIINIEASWFTVDKPNKKKIIFSINKNETGKEREFLVLLVDRNSYYTYVSVKQSAD